MSICLAYKYIYIGKIGIFNANGGINKENQQGNRLQVSKNQLLNWKQLPRLLEELENKAKKIQL